MRKWKKGLALALSGMMTVGLLGACGNDGDSGKQTDAGTKQEDTQKGGADQEGSEQSQTGEMETVAFHMPAAANFTEDGVAAVEEEMNKILGEKYNIQVDLNYIPSGNYGTQMNMSMTTDECDVVSLLGLPMDTFVNNGQLVPLTEYFDASSDTMKNTFTDQELSSVTYGDTLYGLPRKWWGGGEGVVFMSKKIVEELGIDVSKITSLEELDKVLYQVHEAYPDIYTLVPGSMTNTLIGPWNFADGISDTTGKYGVVPILDEDFDENNMKVETIFETDTFREFCNYTYKWYQDGLILPDAMSNTIPGKTYIQNDQAFVFFVRKSGTGYTTDAPQTDPWVVSPMITPSVCFTNTYPGVAFGISVNSEHKDAAWTLLEAFYTDPEVATLLTNGIEGEHYVMMDDGTAKHPDGVEPGTCSYSGLDQFYQYPNVMLVPPSQVQGANLDERMKKYNDSVDVSPVMGFRWDSTDCVDEMTAVANIFDKYYSPLVSGLLNPEETIPQVLEELKAAGMDKILASQQKQLDEFVKNK